MQKIEIYIPEEHLDRLAFLHEEDTAVIAYQGIQTNQENVIRAEVFMNSVPEWLSMKLEDMAEIQSFYTYPCTSQTFADIMSDDGETQKGIFQQMPKSRIDIVPSSSGLLKLTLRCSAMPWFSYKIFGVFALSGVYPQAGHILVSGSGIGAVFLLDRLDRKIQEHLVQQLQCELEDPARRGPILKPFSQQVPGPAQTSISLGSKENRTGLNLKTKNGGLFTRFAIQSCLTGNNLTLQEAWFNGQKGILNDFLVVRTPTGNKPDHNEIMRLQNDINGDTDDKA